MELYTRSLEERKDDRTVYSNRAQALLNLEKWKRALKDCNTAIEIFEVFDSAKFKPTDTTVTKMW